MDWLNTILYPIEVLVAWIMYGWHKLFTIIGMPEASGWTWAWRSSDSSSSCARR